MGWILFLESGWQYSESCWQILESWILLLDHWTLRNSASGIVEMRNSASGIVDSWNLWENPKISGQMLKSEKFEKMQKSAKSENLTNLEKSWQQEGITPGKASRLTNSWSYMAGPFGKSLESIGLAHEPPAGLISWSRREVREAQPKIAKFRQIRENGRNGPAQEENIPGGPSDPGVSTCLMAWPNFRTSRMGHLLKAHA